MQAALRLIGSNLWGFSLSRNRGLNSHAPATAEYISYTVFLCPSVGLLQAFTAYTPNRKGEYKCSALFGCGRALIQKRKTAVFRRFILAFCLLCGCGFKAYCKGFLSYALNLIFDVFNAYPVISRYCFISVPA